MKKKLLAVMLTIGVCLGIIGCSPDHNVEWSDSEGNKESESSMFVAIEYNDLDGVVCYQKGTNVMYWVSRGSYNYGNLTMLVNPDGSPMLYGVDYREEK